MIIDFHTHIFPDKIAKHAVEHLEKQSKSFAKAVFNGTLNGLLNQMKTLAIDKSVICSIATKPEQVSKANDWSISIKSEKILPLGTLHPNYKNNKDELKKLIDAGIKGIKIHPQYQDWDITSSSFFQIMELLCKDNFFALFHSGHDSAYPGDERACPIKLAGIKKRIPELKTVFAHFGGWTSWERVNEHLTNFKNTWFDTSYTFDYININLFKKIAKKIGKENILFATDTPWLHPAKEIKYIKKYFNEEDLESIFSKNAISLLEKVNYEF
jgi:uncharacterized protein